MIRIPCVCGRSVGYENPGAGLPVRCECGQIVRPAWAGRANADVAFTSRLVVKAGPQRVGEHIVLGGDGPIEAGKVAGKPILLNGPSVSRGHCRFVRTGGQWVVEDQNSTNGLYVDGSRTTRAELTDGTVIDIGEFELHFANVVPASANAQATKTKVMAVPSAPAGLPPMMMPTARDASVAPKSLPRLTSDGVVHTSANDDSGISLGFRDEDEVAPPRQPVAPPVAPPRSQPAIQPTTQRVVRPPSKPVVATRPDDHEEVIEIDPLPDEEIELVEEKNDLYDIVASFDTAPKPPSSSVMNSPAVMASRRPLGAPTMASASRMAATAPAPVSGPPVVCPSCAKTLAPGSKICVDCGIYTATGRPLVTAKGLDEDDLAITAHNWISTVSWVMRFGLFPIASEAFGTFKPKAIKLIAWITVATSLVFFLGYHLSGDDEIEKMNSGIAGLMQWDGKKPHIEVEATEEPAGSSAPSPSPNNGQAKTADDAPDPSSLFTDDELAALERIDQKQENGESLTAAERRLLARAERRMREAGFAFDEDQPDFKHSFQLYQLLTCAFLHDPGGNIYLGWIAMAYHLGGNLVFMLVFGMAVNSLIGDVKLAIVYPVLAIGSSIVNWIMTADHPLHPSLGASGAVMGLAGMYFVLFPTSKLRMVIWWRWGFIGKFALHYKLFAVRGFWMLLFWIIWNDVIPVILAKYLELGSDGVAHWAHLGGFAVGAGVAMVLLLARQANSRGGDILSVALGRYAWSILGKPTQWKAAETPAVRAIPLSYPTVVAEN